MLRVKSNENSIENLIPFTRRQIIENKIGFSSNNEKIIKILADYDIRLGITFVILSKYKTKYSHEFCPRQDEVEIGLRFQYKMRLKEG